MSRRILRSAIEQISDSATAPLPDLKACPFCAEKILASAKDDDFTVKDSHTLRQNALTQDIGKLGGYVRVERDTQFPRGVIADQCQNWSMSNPLAADVSQ
jgi:hypothetical protein